MARSKNQDAKDKSEKKMKDAKKKMHRKSKEGETKLGAIKVKVSKTKEGKEAKEGKEGGAKKNKAWGKIKSLQKSLEPCLAEAPVYRTVYEMMQYHGFNSPLQTKEDKERRKKLRIQPEAIRLIVHSLDADMTNLYRVAKLLSVRLNTSHSRSNKKKGGLGTRRSFETRVEKLKRAAEHKNSEDGEKREKAAAAIVKLRQLKEAQRCMPYPVFHGDPGCQPKHLKTASDLIRSRAMIP